MPVLAVTGRLWRDDKPPDRNFIDTLSEFWQNQRTIEIKTHSKGDVMTIAARCQDCEKLYKVDVKLAGKRVRCKACGGVVAVPLESTPAPRQAEQRASAPAVASRKPAARQAPAARAEPDDPFSNMDALLSLESSGTVEDNPAPVSNPAKSRRTPIEPSGADNVLAPAAYSPGRSRRGSGNSSPDDYSPRSWRGAYISLPHEDAIDAYVPVATIGILLVFVVIMFIRIMSAANGMSEFFPPGFVGKVFANTLGRFAGMLGATFGILAPLCMLGVIIAAKIMKFETPGGFYMRCAAVACTPISLIIVVNGFGFGEPTPISGIVALPVMLGVLWLMFRLRILSYLVNAGCVLVFLVVIPSVIGMMLHRSTGFSFAGMDTFNSRSSRSDDTQSDKSLANLRLIGQSLQMYSDQNKGAYPKTLDVLPKSAQLDPNALRSPLGPKAYVYTVEPGTRQQMSGEYIVAYDPNTDEKHAVPALFGDGHAERITRVDFTQRNQKVFQARLEAEIAKKREEYARTQKRPDPPVRSIPRPDPVAPANIDFPAHHAKVEESLKKVAAELKKYADAHDGKYPMVLNQMFPPDGGLTRADLHPGNGSVIVYAGQWLKGPLPRDVFIVYEMGIKDKKRTIIRGDLTVETIDIATWPEMLQKSNMLKGPLMQH
jgi:hypothetical protein